jgi:hypothetical protein
LTKQKRKYMAAYRLKNKKKIAARNRAWRRKNKKKISKLNAAYRRKNRKKRAAYSAAYGAEWRRKNKKKTAKYGAKWRRKNKKKIAEYFRKNKKKIAEQRRNRYKHKLRKRQVPGAPHTFLCGCSGVLPIKGESNQFSRFKSGGSGFICRALYILLASKEAARRGGYAPIDKRTPHSLIRELMKVKECWRCRKSLEWVFGKAKTPHLHHNHETGEIYGFTHPHCNPKALEHENEELRERICKQDERIGELESELEVRAAIAA